MGYRIDTVEAAPTTIAAVRATTTWAEFGALWPYLLDQVWAFLRATDRVAKDGHNVMLYSRQDDTTVDVAVGVQVGGRFPREGNVEPVLLPTGTTARTVHQSHPATIRSAHEELGRWCLANRREPAGPRWEIYGDPRPDGATDTEVYWLLR